MNGLRKCFFQCFDLDDKAITSGLIVTVRTTAGATATIYADETGTAKTNPITEVLFDAIGSGIVEFFSAATAFDIEIEDALGNRVYVSDWTPGDSRIVFAPYKSDRPAHDLVYANIAVGTPVLHTDTNAHAFDVLASIPGASLRAGDVLHITGQVLVTGVNSTPNLTVALKVATEAIADTGAIAVIANDLVNLDFMITVNAIGASGKLAGFGHFMTKLNATHAVQVKTKAEATEDVSGDFDVTLTGLWSAAHADNHAIVNFLNVEVLRLWS